MYQWKLLNHVSREHGRTLKPAHLSYKCTVCTATFGMYKQFESHVYSAHSGVAKKSSDKGKSQASSSALVPDATEPTTATITSSPVSNNSTTAANDSGSNSGASLLKQPFKINDEITITPQPAARPNRTSEIESHVIGKLFFTSVNEKLRRQLNELKLIIFHLELVVSQIDRRN